MSSFLLFLLNIIILVSGQVAFKSAALSLEKNGSGPLGMILNPLALFALFLYAIGAFLWMMVLRRFPLSVAYPILSVTYIILIIAASFLFHEEITVAKILGCIFIMIGIFILSRGGF